EAQRLAHVGSWHRNLALGTAVWSDETYRIFGLEPASTPPPLETVLALMHADDRKMIVDFLAAGTSTRFALDVRIQRPDGSLRHAHSSIEMSRAPDGKVVELVGTIQDITDRKVAEESLRQAHHELETRVEERTR